MLMKGIDMEYGSNVTESVLDHAARNAWYAFGLWLHVVIVGVGILATGVALLLDRIHPPTSALAWLVGGGALAALAWRNSRMALRRIHRAEQAESQHNLRPRHRLRVQHPLVSAPAAGGA